jgi:predicted enzyme related to lactoylglutathione lyase
MERVMNHGVTSIVFPVNDLAQARPFYANLFGVDPHVDSPYYVGFRIGDLEIGLDPNGHRVGGPVGYWRVDDLSDRLHALVVAGARIEQEITDVGGGRRIAILRDPDGNAFGLLQDSQ